MAAPIARGFLQVQVGWQPNLPSPWLGQFRPKLDPLNRFSFTLQGYQFEDDELYGDDDDAYGNDGERTIRP